jgi:hypothetical protein
MRINMLSPTDVLVIASAETLEGIWTHQRDNAGRTCVDMYGANVEETARAAAGLAGVPAERLPDGTHRIVLANPALARNTLELIKTQCARRGTSLSIAGVGTTLRALRDAPRAEGAGTHSTTRGDVVAVRASAVKSTRIEYTSDGRPQRVVVDLE